MIRTLRLALAAGLAAVAVPAPAELMIAPTRVVLTPGQGSAAGSFGRTPVRPCATHSTVTSHGSSSPIDGSAESELNASGELHAPRIT